MSTAYDAAVEALYRGPVDTFVAERKRLASELKAAGDKDGAARLSKLGRPTISAWAVNQLYWHERDAFERLLASAERLKKGALEAGAEHREALGDLRALAAARLTAAGHAAPEATMRRVISTLSAVAAAGGFEPDPAGALAADRDPPGFESFALASKDADEAPFTRGGATEHGGHAHAKRRDDAEHERKRAAEERRRLEEERRRLEEERVRKKEERDKLARELTAAQSDTANLQYDADRLRSELRGVEAKLEKARDKVERLKAALAASGEVGRS